MLQYAIFALKIMNFNQLAICPLFKGVSTEEIISILSVVPYRTRNYRTGSLIAQSGEPVNALMIVTIGTVKGEMVDDAGRVIKIEDIPAPGSLATAFIFGNKNSFPVNVAAISDVEILSIEKPDFLRLLMSNDRVLVNFLNMISNRSQFLSEKIKFLNFKTIKGKLAHYILQKAGNEKISVSLGMTQNDLADFFGVARPSVSRALGELEQDGLIEASGKNIRILDKKGLAGLIAE
jgi:CRP/FNR family transcriptional regulator, dissimilatory nitrate respiration regulator